MAAVSRRHGVCSSLIYRWPQQIKSGELSAEVPAFVPVNVLEAPRSTSIVTPASRPATPEPAAVERRSVLVEVALANGCVLRVAEDILSATLRRLVGALDGP